MATRSATAIGVPGDGEPRVGAPRARTRTPDGDGGAHEWECLERRDEDDARRITMI